MLLARAADPIVAAVADSLVLPPMFTRASERVRLVNEVAAEAAVRLGIPLRAFSAADRNFILESDAATLPEIETATVRLLAIRHWSEQWGGIGRAANALAMTRAALREWAERRGLIAVHRRKDPSRRRSRTARPVTARPRHA